MDPDHLERLRIRSEAKRRPRRAVWTIFLLVLALTGGALFLAWPRLRDQTRVLDAAGQKTNSNAAKPGTVPTNAPPPAGAKSNVVLTVSGYIVNHERIELSPRFLGVVKWIGVKKGDIVTNGQVVVLLDDAEQRARLLEAEGRRSNSLVALAKAELDYQRVHKLVTQNIETQQNEDDARLRLESARASVTEVRAQLELIQTYLDWTVIRSPIDGVVLEKLAHAGELVTPQSFGGGRGPSTAVLAVADPKDLQVEIDLSEGDVAKVFAGQECLVSPEAYPDKSYRAYVAEMSPEANRQKGTLQIKVQIRDPDRYLTPELSAKVEFLAGPPKAAR
jgi:HlyD family secretion protein